MLRFDMIDGLPNGSQGRMSTTMTELDWQAVFSVPCVAGATRRQGP